MEYANAKTAVYGPLRVNPAREVSKQDACAPKEAAGAPGPAWVEDSALRRLLATEEEICERLNQLCGLMAERLSPFLRPDEGGEGSPVKHSPEPTGPFYTLMADRQAAAHHHIDQVVRLLLRTVV